MDVALKGEVVSLTLYGDVMSIDRNKNVVGAH